MKLYIVGFGSGNRKSITLEAETAVRNSALIVGYSVYVQILKNWFPEKEYAFTGMRQEKERVILALQEAIHRNVSLVCSGDAELYGMAGLALELSENYPDTEIEIISGVTAAFSGGALLGAPLTHDFAVISLSDLLTPAEKIRKRLTASAEADFVIVLYNPSSRTRADYLQKACDILLKFRSPETVCGIARNIGRDEESYRILSLAELRNTSVDMFTTVFIGNSETKIINGRMVTPRGYRNV
ncbi:MAG: precorrin-3B C(17)-methyltransferase [Oscillospiraceae bacterium]|nr:precorrin-3B C(17)-methyltransferase [Oscillospiraceae bacterium]